METGISTSLRIEFEIERYYNLVKSYLTDRIKIELKLLRLLIRREFNGIRDVRLYYTIILSPVIIGVSYHRRN